MVNMLLQYIIIIIIIFKSFWSIFINRNVRMLQVLQGKFMTCYYAALII